MTAAAFLKCPSVAVGYAEWIDLRRPKYARITERERQTQAVLKRLALALEKEYV